jgi:hypothetical protein
MRGLRHSADDRAKSYATATDFVDTFIQEMDSLYQLSLLLTADTGKAERCFVCAIKDCVDGAGVERPHEGLCTGEVHRSLCMCDCGK